MHSESRVQSVSVSASASVPVPVSLLCLHARRNLHTHIAHARSLERALSPHINMLLSRTHAHMSPSICAITGLRIDGLRLCVCVWGGWGHISCGCLCSNWCQVGYKMKDTEFEAAGATKVRLCMYACMYACISACMYACIYVCMSVCICVYASKQACMYRTLYV